MQEDGELEDSLDYIVRLWKEGREGRKKGKGRERKGRKENKNIRKKFYLVYSNKIY
jgi:hypothetical protein